jgi:hypothetical protein
MSQRFLWEFEWVFGRGGNVTGLFVASEEEIERNIGKYVYFGEIRGKHSEVYGTLDREDLTKIDLDSETVEKVTKILGTTWSGRNPLNHIKQDCSRCGDTYHQEELWDIEDKYVCWNCMSEEEKEYGD